MQHTPTFALTRILAVAVAAHTLLDFQGNPAAAGEKAIGATQYGGNAGDAVSVTVQGTAMVRAGAAIGDGAAVMSDAQGRAVPVANGGNVAGYALQAASAPEQLIEVLLTP